MRMTSMISTIVGVLVPFIGTTAGAACVFFLKNQIKPKIQKALLGSASGVMVAASVWSLLLPSIDMSDGMGRMAFVPAAAGLALGVLFLLLLDKMTEKLKQTNRKGKADTGIKKRTAMLALAVTLHNIPEGMAVGVAFAGAIMGADNMTLAGAMTLAVGIGVQNIPEGAIISLPLRGEGKSKGRAFSGGTLSGIVEPIAAGITIMLARFIEPVLPYLLALAAGAMLYVVVKELIPESAEGEKSNIGVIGFTLGFLVMMVLDVALG